MSECSCKMLYPPPEHTCEKHRLELQAEINSLRTEIAQLKKQVRGICESASKLQEPLDYGDDAASELFHRCVEQAKQILKELEN